MRNDNKSWKKGVQRVGKQFGGMLTRPLGGALTGAGNTLAGARTGVGNALAGARGLYNKGKSVVKNNVYKKGGKAK